MRVVSSQALQHVTLVKSFLDELAKCLDGVCLSLRLSEGLDENVVDNFGSMSALPSVNTQELEQMGRVMAQWSLEPPYSVKQEIKVLTSRHGVS